MTSIQSEPTSLKPGRENQLSGRPCPICIAPVRVCEAIDELLLRGDKTAAVHRWAVKKFPAELGALKYDTFTRHARYHVKAIARAVRKLSDHARLQRKKVDTAQAVLRDEVDPVSFFGPAEIARDVSKTEKRLDIAADDAFSTRQHSALASLSSALLRSHELRAKMGGSIRPDVEVNISLGLEQLHGRLDQLVGAPTGDRQNTARSLLGLASPVDAPIPSRVRPERDLSVLTNPGGEALTIDIEPSEAPNYRLDPESRPTGPADGEKGYSEVVPTPDFAPVDDYPVDDPTEIPVSWANDEPLGTRWR